MAEGLDAATAAAIVEESVARSLKRLRRETLPICLFHIEENFCYAEALLRLKERGLVGHIGSSVMTPPATKAIIDTGLAEGLQIPTSVLDHRFSHARGHHPKGGRAWHGGLYPQHLPSGVIALAGTRHLAGAGRGDSPPLAA